MYLIPAEAGSLARVNFIKIAFNWKFNDLFKKYSSLTKRNVFYVYTFSQLKNLANDAKIRFSLNVLLYYIKIA